MVAPIDASVTFDVGGETIALRLNFRSIALLEAAGLDLFGVEGVKMTLVTSARMLQCLSVNDHALSDDEALAVVARHGEAFGKAVLECIARFGGKVEDEGNVEAAPKAA